MVPDVDNDTYDDGNYFYNKDNLDELSRLDLTRHGSARLGLALLESIHREITDNTDDDDGDDIYSFLYNLLGYSLRDYLLKKL